MSKLLRAATPIQLLVLGFALIVLVGATLLSMPFSSTARNFQPFVDSVFMASSAISTTGLVVADIGRDYTLFGQLVMLVIIQIGGIGYMCFVPLVLMGLFGGQLSIGTRMLLRESMARPTWLDMVKFTKVILISTAIIEAVGAAVLAAYWSRQMPVGAVIYAGIWHSISAFCTAGMSIWSENMVRIGTKFLPNVTLIVLELLGGIGFFVLYDIARQGKKLVRGIHPRTLTTHSKLALTVTGLVITIGTFVILTMEWPRTSLAAGPHALAALFQAVSASTTTGYNTLDIGQLAPPTQFIICMLMFIGASPNSTGGGIKTTTLGVMVAGFWALLRGRDDVNIFRRRIASRVLHSAYGLTLLAVAWCVTVIAVMLAVESAPFINVCFEAISAFGNVGLSTGITASLTTLSKILIAVTMFFGRVGPLAVGFSLFGRRETPLHRYAEDDVFVG